MNTAVVASTPQFPSSRSGLDELLERERQDARSADEELQGLAMRIARNENVSAAEIDVILTDCSTTPGTLKRMVAQATEALKLGADIDAERIDAAEFLKFQEEVEELLRFIAANEAKIRELIVATEGAKNQARLAVLSRYAKTESIARKAAESAATLANSGTVATRTPAVIRSLPTICRHTDWIDTATKTSIARRREKVRSLGAEGRLPDVAPIQVPDGMIDSTPTPPEPVTPELPAMVETETPAVAESTPTPEAPSRHRARRRPVAAVTPGDLADEPSDLG